MLVLTPSGKIAAGAIEGALIAAALCIVLRYHEIEVDFRSWIIAVVVADIVRWMIPIVGSPRASMAAVFWKGLLAGLVVISAQVFALRVRGTTRTLWHLAGLPGWILAMFFFNSAMGWFRRALMQSPALPSAFIGLVSGLLIGAATSLAVARLRRPAGAMPAARLP